MASFKATIFVSLVRLYLGIYFTCLQVVDQNRPIKVPALSKALSVPSISKKSNILKDSLKRMKKLDAEHPASRRISRLLKQLSCTFLDTQADISTCVISRSRLS